MKKSQRFSPTVLIRDATEEVLNAQAPPHTMGRGRELKTEMEKGGERDRGREMEKKQKR